MQALSLSHFLEKIKDTYDIYLLLTTVFIGLFLMFIDCPQLLKRGFNKEFNIAKYLGYFYLIGGAAGYILVSIFG